MSHKGSKYERDVCRELSLWWSEGKHDDLFWRASQSGGRATQRAKSGKRTVGHCGDLCCTGSAGESLIQVFTVESKRGYGSRAFMADLLDRDKWPADPKARKFTMLGMIEQAKAASERAGTPCWLLIHRRDKREALAYAPRDFFTRHRIQFGGADRIKVVVGGYDLLVLKLPDFLEIVKPSTIRKIARNLYS